MLAQIASMDRKQCPGRSARNCDLSTHLIGQLHSSNCIDSTHPQQCHDQPGSQKFRVEHGGYTQWAVFIMVFNTPLLAAGLAFYSPCSFGNNFKKTVTKTRKEQKSFVSS